VHPGPVEPVGILLDPADQPLTGGARRLLGDGRRVVGHRAIDLVADPGDDRDGCRGDGASHGLRVEYGEIEPGAATTHQGDHVDNVGCEAAEGGCHLMRRRLPLNIDVGRLDGKAIRGTPQLVDEITVGSRAPAGDQSDPQRDQWPGQELVGGK
jgi:hypothetical protein